LKKIFIYILLMIATSGLLNAQNIDSTQLISQSELGTTIVAPNTAAYNFSGTMNESDQLNILTYIWGQIERPGLYIVPDDTDVLTLISLAGGPTVDARLKSIRIVRNSEFAEEQIITVDMKKYIETGDYSLIPRLMPGDTVIVQGTSFYAFSRVVTFLSQVAITLSVYFTIRALF